MPTTTDREEVTATERFYQCLIELMAVEPVPVVEEGIRLLAKIASAQVVIELWEQQEEGRVTTFRCTAGEAKQGIVERVPIGLDEPVGVLYLHRTPANFRPIDRARAELFARQLALIAGRISQRKRSLTNETRMFQRGMVRLAMARHGGNVSAVSRELRVTRSRIYRIMAKRR